MQDFNKQNSVLSEEDLDNNTQFIYDFAEKLATKGSGLAGGSGENAVSREIRDAVLSKTGEFSHLEAFGVNRLMGKGSFLVFGIIYAIALLIYFISFAGNSTAQILITLLALVIFVLGLILLWAMLLNKFRFKDRFKVAYNVVSEKKSEKISDETNMKTVIIAANHSGNYGGFSLAYGKLHKIALVYMPISYLLFIIYCIVKMAVGTNNTGNIVALTVLPVITSILGIIATVTRYSIFDKRAIKNNGIASALALSTYAYFVETPELIPNNTRIVFASLGGESDNQSGSKAFILAHPEYKGANVVLLDNIVAREIQVNKCGSRRGSAYSLKMEEDVTKSASMQGIDLSKEVKDKFEEKINKFYGSTIDSFFATEMPSVCIAASAKEDAVISITKEDINKLLSLCVGTVRNCLHDIKNPQ